MSKLYIYRSNLLWLQSIQPWVQLEKVAGTIHQWVVLHERSFDMFQLDYNDICFSQIYPKCNNKALYMWSDALSMYKFRCYFSEWLLLSYHTIEQLNCVIVIIEIYSSIKLNFPSQCQSIQMQLYARKCTLCIVNGENGVNTTSIPLSHMWIVKGGMWRQIINKSFGECKL